MAQDNTLLRLKPKQRELLEVAQNVGLNRNITVVCEEAGVPRRNFYNWLERDPDFREAWETVWYGTIKKHMPGVLSAVVKQAQGGVVQAARLLADISGIIKQKIALGGDDTLPALRIIVDDVVDGGGGGNN